MLRYISHLSFSTRATLHLTLSPPPAELRGDFLFLSFVRVRVLISSFLPIQLGRKSKSDLVLQLNAKESQRRSHAKKEKMEREETGCQAPEGPILCINNCGFFGSAATMNMCSKCHKELVLNQEQAKLVASSVDSIVNGNGSSSSGKDPVVAGTVDLSVGSVDKKHLSSQAGKASTLSEGGDAKAKEGPNRCSTCRKRVGLTGFNCRCGNLFCASHRYSDKHDCPFDYRMAAQDAISKANPVVKAEKLDKI